MTCGNHACPFHELEAEAGALNGTDLACRVTDTVKQVRFDAGAILFAQGEPSTSLYSLSRGIVKITCHTTGGREQIVGIANPGSLLLGLQSLETDLYQYTAVAETDVVACKIRHRGLLKEAEHSSDIALRLLKALNAQLAQSRELMRVMGHKCAAAKIASFITMPRGRAYPAAFHPAILTRRNRQPAWPERRNRLQTDGEDETQRHPVLAARQDPDPGLGPFESRCRRGLYRHRLSQSRH